jgi:hypothetical protein
VTLTLIRNILFQSLFCKVLLFPHKNVPSEYQTIEPVSNPEPSKATKLASAIKIRRITSKLRVQAARKNRNRAAVTVEGRIVDAVPLCHRATLRPKSVSAQL